MVAKANKELEPNICVYKHCRIRTLHISLFFKRLKVVLLLKLMLILIYRRAVVFYHLVALSVVNMLIFANN